MVPIMQAYCYNSEHFYFLGNIDRERLQINLTYTNIRLLCTHLQVILMSSCKIAYINFLKT